MCKIIAITDLDGTLLHPETYSFEEALPALGLLKERNIPLVLCSSKTRKEIELYRGKLGNTDPFVSENGGAIFIPEGYFPFPAGQKKGHYEVITLGAEYAGIRKVFSDIKKELRVKAKGFGDMTAEEVSALAGVAVEEARLAKEREFDEPFVAENEKDETAIFEAIERRGLKWTKGRFCHVLGDNDKGKAVKILKGFFEKAFGKITVIGLGDALNDLPLLKEADFPILIRKTNGDYERGINIPNLIKTDEAGPKGWNEAIIELITRMKF